MGTIDDTVYGWLDYSNITEHLLQLIVYVSSTRNRNS